MLPKELEEALRCGPLLRNCVDPVRVSKNSLKNGIAKMFGRSAGRLAGRPGGAHVVSGAEKQNHLIEAAPFGRLDQM